MFLRHSYVAAQTSDYGGQIFIHDLVGNTKKALLIKKQIVFPFFIFFCSLLLIISVYKFGQEKVKYYDIATEKRAEFEKAMAEYNKKKVHTIHDFFLVASILFLL